MKDHIFEPTETYEDMSDQGSCTHNVSPGVGAAIQTDSNFKESIGIRCYLMAF